MLPYIGGKSLISKNLIVPNIPNDIEVYVEPFSGMYWVLFNMDLDNYTNLKKIVYNDFNPLNYNLFRCVSQDHERLLSECEKIPVQKKGEFPTPVECSEFFNLSQKELYGGNLEIGNDPNYEVAAKHALILSSVFSGANPSKAKFVDLKGKYHSKFSSFMNKLRNPKWQKMFESITDVENMDFEDVIKKYDSDKTYFYVDPPYYIVGEGSYYSNHDFSREDHLRLSDSLKSMKGRFSLSYYDFDQLSEWYPKDRYIWKSKDFHKAAMAKQGKEQTKATELLIMNYEMD
jgi:DNA adenine methylase